MWWRWGAVGVLVVLQLRCADDPGPAAGAPTADAVPSGDTATRSALASRRLVTFKTGLAPNLVEASAECAPEVAKVIAALEADVVCVQEAWLAVDIGAIEAASTDSFPCSHSLTPEGPGERTASACTDVESGPLEACVDASCSDAPVLAECTLTSCGAEFGAVSAECQGSLAANLDKDADGIFAACTQGGTSYAHGGSCGLLLLSRLPLGETSSLVLDSVVAGRAVLHATVQVEGEPVRVSCTHLTALEVLDYAGARGSWEGQVEHEVEAMGAFFDATAGTAGATLVMGDPNFGPAVAPDIEAEAPAAFQGVLDLGFDDPHLAQEHPPCTWCTENSPVADDDEDNVVDHVLTRKLGPMLDHAVAERTLEQPVTVVRQGEPRPVEPSEHFGVRVTLLLTRQGPTGPHRARSTRTVRARDTGGRPACSCDAPHPRREGT